MTKLTTQTRKNLKKSEFALPESRKYPVDTRARAANAKSRATQMEEKGVISKSTENKIDSKANKVLNKKGSNPK